MTKEPIMIDDVDVAKCDEYYADGLCLTGVGSTVCKHNPNCYYKQLKRKEQECEEWKHQAELGSDTTDRLAKQLEEKEQILDDCREELCWLHNQLDALEAENEKLRQYKGSKQASYETMQKECNEAKNEVKQLKAENKKLKICYENNLTVLRHEEKVNNNLTDRIMKAEQALQKIREVVELAIEEVLTIGQRNATAKILEIIQKCEVINEKE